MLDSLDSENYKKIISYATFDWSIEKICRSNIIHEYDKIWWIWQIALQNSAI